MPNTHMNMSVSTISISCHDKFTSLMLKHTKSLEVIFQVGKCPKLVYFHEIQLDVLKYAQYPNKYVCFHY